jgi:hypothetical protein
LILCELAGRFKESTTGRCEFAEIKYVLPEKGLSFGILSCVQTGRWNGEERS